MALACFESYLRLAQKCAVSMTPQYSRQQLWDARTRSNRHSYPLLTLSPIHPTRTIHTPLRLLANILPTELALNLLLHNVIIRAARIRKCDYPQRQRNAHETDHFVDEIAPREYHRAVVERLFHGVVPRGDGAVVGGAALQDGEFLVEVAREEGEERDYGEDYVRDERVGAGGECGGEATSC
jgi:hypothetical protein